MEIAVIVLAVAVVAAALIMAFARPKTAIAEPAKPDARLDMLLAKQGEIGGQFTQTVAAQEALTRTLGERLEALEKRLGDNLAATAKQTGETFVSITERLSVIDAAQKNITALSDQVVSLQDIFSDKQARGAWGQDRMEDIISEQLPPDLYEFQARLSNNSQPDCVIRIPNVNAAIVIDAKFPLEAFNILRLDPNDTEYKQAAQQFRTDIQKHVGDIARKYLIPGEVQTPAIMFIPSESIYSEMHRTFPEMIQRARRQQVVIVSPHILWLAVNVIRTLMRDAKMREQAHQIQKEVGLLLKDVRLLGERVSDLRKHFEKTSDDIGEIEKPMSRISSRAERIEKVDLATPDRPSLPDV